MAISQTVTLDIATGAATVGSMIFMQRESEWRQLEFTVLNAGSAYTLTGFTDKIIVIEKPDGEIIYNNLTDVNQNTAKYTFTSQSQIVKGLLRCWLKFKSGGQIVVTPEFHIRVNEVADFDSAVESASEFGVLDSLIKDASEAVIECNKVSDEMNNMTASFENATASATTLAEGESATVSLTDGVSGKEFTFGIPKGEKGDPGEKGDDALQQIDFVDFIQKRARHYSSMAYQKVSATLQRVILSDGTRHITYSFQKDTHDDFIRLASCYAGTLTDYLYDSEKATVDVLVGTWTTPNANYYTTTPGDTFALSAKGSKLKLSHYTETRGGRWSILIDGETTVYVSCYAESSGLATTTLVSGLDPNVTHTIVGTFLGNDPDHAPSSSPSRGYIYAGSPGTLAGYVDVGASTYIIMSGGSNKEFAFFVSKNGVENWIPEHNAIGSAFASSPAEVYLDNVLVDTTALENGYYVLIDSFEIKQFLTGQIASTETDVLQIKTSHKIDEKGVLSFSGSFSAIESVSITGYPLMIPTDANYADEFVTGIMNNVVNAGDDSYTYFAEETDRVYSVATLSSTNRGVIGAVTLSYPLKSYRVGKSGKPTLGQDMFAWNRIDVPKLYFQSFLNHLMQAGEFYVWGFELTVSEIDNVYDLIFA